MNSGFFPCLGDSRAQRAKILGSFSVFEGLASAASENFGVFFRVFPVFWGILGHFGAFGGDAAGW